MGIRVALVRITVCAAVMALMTGSRTSHASSGASPEDEVRLAAGETVSYPETLQRHGKRSVGGVSYTVVNASVSELSSLLGDMTAYRQVLPHARDARLVGHVGDDRLVEITQGTALVQAAYTLRMRTDMGGRRVRFWLDRDRPHGIDDAWGFFRVEPMADGPDGAPRVLLTYGCLVDLGPGLVRELFEDRVQASILSVPRLVREYAWARFRSRPRVAAL